jgi:hypothetical protein
LSAKFATTTSQVMSFSASGNVTAGGSVVYGKLIAGRDINISMLFTSSALGNMEEAKSDADSLVFIDFDAQFASSVVKAISHDDFPTLVSEINEMKQVLEITGQSLNEASLDEQDVRELEVLRESCHETLQEVQISTRSTSKANPR